MPGTLFAIHISSGVLATPWWVGGYVGMAVLLALASYRVSDREVPRIGVLTAAFFVGSYLHVPLLVLPAKVHLILNGLVGVVLGRRAPLAIAVGLTLQALLLHHGGLESLGLNACVIAIPALAAGLLFPLFRRAGVPAFASGVVLGGFAVAGAAGLNFLALLLGGKEDWETLAKLVLLAHVPVVIVEGLILGVVVRYLDKVKPEMLRS
jgi:cobalt/nickel transport system permease protein